MEWSEGMSFRLRRYLDNFRDDFTGMITLTYPDKFPKDGKVVKAHWRAFVERLRRIDYFAPLRDGHAPSMVWFLEFQARGAPHLHALCTQWISKVWVAEAWSSITGGDVRACSRVEALRSPTKAADYAIKYAQKSEQKKIPPEFINVGRMWGCVGERIDGLGKARVPVVEASITQASPDGLKLYLERKLTKLKGRMYLTLSGFVFYGSEEEVNEAWRYLTDAEQYAGLYAQPRAGLTRRQ